MFSDALIARATTLVAACRARGLTLATAESCTGGLVASLLTEVPGASAVFERGLVTYSNEAKSDLLGVPPALIAQHGAVSAPVAAAMVEGLLLRSGVDIAVSVTGVAGPGGGTAEKPVGLVHFGCMVAGGRIATVERRFGDKGRSGVRLAAVAEVIDLMEAAAGWADAPSGPQP